MLEFEECIHVIDHATSLFYDQSTRGGRRTKLSRAQAHCAELLLDEIEGCDYHTINDILVACYNMDYNRVKSLLIQPYSTWEEYCTEVIQLPSEQVAVLCLTNNEYKAVRHPVDISKTRYAGYLSWDRLLATLLDLGCEQLVYTIRSMIDFLGYGKKVNGYE